MLLSICIPTYNRSKYLTNCLQSIVLNKNRSIIDFEVCISDNFSTDNTEDVVRAAQKNIPIIYHKHESYIGRVKNYLNVVNIANGDFIWLIGDDDLLLPNALYDLDKLISKNKDVEFFYINSFCLESEYVMSCQQPFNTNNLPHDMRLFSTWITYGNMNFMDLINPKISFDFLGGMFLAVFKRDNWINNINVLDNAAVSDLREYSHFDNTFPHIKIFSKAFAKSKAYFNPDPLSVNLSGIREWSSLSPLVNSVRLIEALYEYRKNGLSLYKYLLYKNYALNNFLPDMAKIIFYKGKTGIEYINPVTLIISNLLYPNFYLSILYFFFKRIRRKYRGS